MFVCALLCLFVSQQIPKSKGRKIAQKIGGKFYEVDVTERRLLNPLDKGMHDYIMNNVRRYARTVLRVKPKPGQEDTDSDADSIAASDDDDDGPKKRKESYKVRCCFGSLIFVLCD